MDINKVVFITFKQPLAKGIVTGFKLTEEQINIVNRAGTSIQDKISVSVTDKNMFITIPVYSKDGKKQKYIDLDQILG